MSAELFTAMALAFPKIEGALKDSENGAFKVGGRASKYADLSSVVDAVKPALTENGLFFAQLTHEQTGGVCIETVVGHKSGEVFSFGKLFVPASKQDAHGYGSALTYARRYSLMTAFGVCPEDDDGNAAAANPVERINPGQEIELSDLAREVNADLARFLGWAGVQDMKDIPASMYAEAKRMLEKKRLKPSQQTPVSEVIADEIPY